MPSHAGMHVHVECSAPDRGMAGLDGKIEALFYLSWVLEGDDPTDPAKHHHVEVPLRGRDVAPGGQGDDAVSLATAVTTALRGHANAPAGVRIGTSRNEGATSTGKKTVRTDAFIEFDGIESIDCGCCDALGKVEIEMYGNVTRQVYTKSIRTQTTKKKDTIVDVIPVSVALDNKETCKPEHLKEPKDKLPDDPHGPRTPKGPLRNPDVPPTTPINPASPPPPVTTRSEPSGPRPPPPPPPPPWSPFPVAEPFKAGPYAGPPSPPTGPSPGSEGGGGSGMRALRPGSTGATAYGVFHLSLGSWPNSTDVRWVSIPWPVIRSSPLGQLQEMLDCLVSAGIRAVLVRNRLLILDSAESGQPVVAFRITMNYAGQGFPWKWTIDLWQPCDPSSVPVSHSLSATLPMRSPVVERREWFVAGESERQGVTQGTVVRVPAFHGSAAAIQAADYPPTRERMQSFPPSPGATTGVSVDTPNVAPPLDARDIDPQPPPFPGSPARPLPSPRRGTAPP